MSFERENTQGWSKFHKFISYHKFIKTIKKQRLCVTSLIKNVIEAEILTECAKGVKIFLPKILLYHNDFLFYL